jgi:exodeoxyribonuclease-3
VPDAVTAPARLRVLTYNILFGGVGREALIGDVVGAIAPDVAVFCEVTDPRAFDVIAGVVGPHRAMSGGRRERIAIVSRWPLEDISAFGPRWSPKKWVRATVVTPTQRLRVHGIHLVPEPLFALELWRRAEVYALMRHLGLCAAPLRIVAGDFNAYAGGDTLRWDATPFHIRAQFWPMLGASPRWAIPLLTRDGWVDCYRTANPAADGFTMPAWDPHVRIDYVFASPSLAASLQSAGTLTRSGPAAPAPRRSLSQLLGRAPIPELGGEASDHLPVWADFDCALLS